MLTESSMSRRTRMSQQLLWKWEFSFARTRKCINHGNNYIKIKLSAIGRGDDNFCVWVGVGGEKCTTDK